MKYILYRSLGSIDKDVKKHKIVGVEFGNSIDDVVDDLIRDAADDLAALTEYENCKTAAYAPEPIKEHRRVKRYQYEMMGIVYPPHADKNIIIDFGIVEVDD